VGWWQRGTYLDRRLSTELYLCAIECACDVNRLLLHSSIACANFPTPFSLSCVLSLPNQSKSHLPTMSGLVTRVRSTGHLRSKRPRQTLLSPARARQDLQTPRQERIEDRSRKERRWSESSGGRAVMMSMGVRFIQETQRKCDCEDVPIPVTARTSMKQASSSMSSPSSPSSGSKSA
jgi:hypothetical protein